MSDIQRLMWLSLFSDSCSHSRIIIAQYYYCSVAAIGSYSYIGESLLPRYTSDLIIDSNWGVIQDYDTGNETQESFQEKKSQRAVGSNLNFPLSAEVLAHYATGEVLQTHVIYIHCTKLLKICSLAKP